METIIFRAFSVLFKIAGILMVAGTLVCVLTDIQKKAFNSRKVGLVSMLKINEQLVGKTK